MNKITLVSYIPKRRRNVILLSSSHGRGTIDPVCPKNKPIMIADYNQGKGGVDQMDENVTEFSTVRKTSRWPLLVFFNMIDVACNNCFLHLKRDGYPHNKKKFLDNLSKMLVSNYAIKRFKNNPKFSKSIRHAGEIMGFVSQQYEAQQTVQQRQKLGRCTSCSKVCRSFCNVCNQPICPAHRETVKHFICYNCLTD